MASVKLVNVTKHFGTVRALSKVSLDISEGEFVSILGSSGCGKTTLLRVIAGFLNPDEGTIEIGGMLVSVNGKGLPPEKRELGMVFQSYALWPHLSVFDNVAYGLRVRRISKAEIRKRVGEALDLVGLSGFEGRKPDQLSGGQRQRVSLARCLVVRPKLVLLDEPLANLDANLRVEMQTELRRIQRESGATFLFVTHAQEEAFALSDRIVVMDRGRILQEDTPRALYQYPKTPTVASFIRGGTVCPAEFLQQTADGRGVVRLGNTAVEVRVKPEATPGPCLICVRSENLTLAGADSTGALEGKVRWVSYQGKGYLIGVEPVGSHGGQLPDGSVRSEQTAVFQMEIQSSDPLKAGSTVRFRIKDAWVIPERDPE